MEREILFRGKRVDNGEWVYGIPVEVEAEYGIKKFIISHAKWDCDDNSIDFLETDVREVIPSTIGQYTGLADKNGKRIFEGDILDLTYYLLVDVGVVKFGEYKDLDMTNDYPCGNVGFYVDVVNQRIYARKDILFFASECKILGNIHDNPELLKGEK